MGYYTTVVDRLESTLVWPQIWICQFNKNDPWDNRSPSMSVGAFRPGFRWVASVCVEGWGWRGWQNGWGEKITVSMVVWLISKINDSLWAGIRVDQSLSRRNGLGFTMLKRLIWQFIYTGDLHKTHALHAAFSFPFVSPSLPPFLLSSLAHLFFYFLQLENGNR